MKRILSVVLSAMLALSLCFTPALAEDEAPEKFSNADGYVYILLEDGTAEITGYTGTNKKLEIPSELDGYTVTSIGFKAFYDNKQLTDVVVPDTVRILNEQCFSWCESLVSVTLPEGIESISYNPFYNCRKLNKVNIPDSVTEVKDGIFAGCDALKESAISPDHPILEVVDGVLFNKAASTILWYPVSRKGKEYTVPDGTLRIGAKAFYNVNLEKIVLPESVENIPNAAFESCSKLKAVNIPPKVSSLDGVFKACNALEAINVDEGNEIFESVDGVLFDKTARALIKFPVAKKDKTYTVPEGTEAILDNAFERTQITGITIPGSVRQIGANVFLFCEKLKEIVLPEGLEELDSMTFQWCSNLVKAELPASLVKVSYNPFLNCSKLPEITIAEGNPALALVNGCLVQTEDMTLVSCPTGIKTKKLEFPEGIRKIGKSAFNNCAVLEEVVFGDGLEEIREDAFHLCKKLKRVVIPASVTEINRTAFDLDNVTNTVFVVAQGSYAENFFTSFSLKVEYAE